MLPSQLIRGRTGRRACQGRDEAEASYRAAPSRRFLVLLREVRVRRADRSRRRAAAPLGLLRIHRDPWHTFPSHPVSVVGPRAGSS